MPEIDGLEATRMIRKLEKGSNLTAIPIIAMTANISDNAWLTQSYKTHTIDSHSSNFIKNRISDFWYDVDVINLAQNMRAVYLQHQSSQESSHDLDQYQFSTVNEMIK